MDWTELIAWVGWAGTIGWAWRAGWRPPFLRPVPVSPQRAQLFHPSGRLDSVRTITGPPPAVIVCRAGRYVIDRTAPGPHHTYRRMDAE